jgi:hypothetical protein
VSSVAHGAFDGTRINTPRPHGTFGQPTSNQIVRFDS